MAKSLVDMKTLQNLNENLDVVKQISNGISQYFLFSELDLEVIEHYVDQMIFWANNGLFRKKTVDRAPLRNKYFFGEGYTYGSQLSRKGRGMERLYPQNEIEPIPFWVQNLVITPLVYSGIIPKDFVNSVVINDYQAGGCIVSHVDPPHIFDRPIVSVSLMASGVLSFGCKFLFKPIRVSEPVFSLAMPRGVVTLLSDFAANGITHCIRPQDTISRRTVILLRRVLPEAPRLFPRELSFKFSKQENTVLKRNDKIYKKFSSKYFKTVKRNGIVKNISTKKYAEKM